MSDKTLKGRPIAERIAKMLGETSFRDGQSGRGLAEVSHTDVVTALGWVQQQEGMSVVQAMETHYGSTLRHEDALRRAWSTHAGEPAKRHQRAVFRFCGALAVRKLAGAHYSSFDHTLYARLLVTERETIADNIDRPLRWYYELVDTGFRAFRGKIFGEEEAA